MGIIHLQKKEYLDSRVGVNDLIILTSTLKPLLRLVPGKENSLLLSSTRRYNYTVTHRDNDNTGKKMEQDKRQIKIEIKDETKCGGCPYLSIKYIEPFLGGHTIRVCCLKYCQDVGLKAQLESDDFVDRERHDFIVKRPKKCIGDSEDKG